MTSYARKAIHGTATVFTLTLLAALVAYLFRMLLARRLSVEDYGLFFALFSFINLLGLFKDLGQGYALLKFIPELIVLRKWNKIKSLISSSFLMQFVSSTVIAGALLIFAPYIMRNIFHSADVKFFSLFAIIFFVSFAQNVVSICFQSFQRMFLFSLQDLLKNIIVLLVTLVLLWFGLGVFAPAWAYLVTYIIVFVAFFAVFSLRVFKKFWRTHISLTRTDFSSLLLFGLPAMLTIFGNNVLQYTDTLMLSYFKDLTSVGIYQAAVPLVTLVIYLAQAISAVLTPLIAELLALKMRKQLRNGIELLHKYLFAVVIPMSIVIVAFPEIFICLFFGNKFISAAAALQVLGAGIVFYAIAYANLNMLFGLGKPKYTTIVMISSAILNILLNLVMIPLLGSVGAAISTFLSYLLMLLLSSREIKRIVRIKEPWYIWAKTLFAALILTGIIACIKAWLSINPWLELLIGGIAGGFVYCLLLLAFGIVTTKEINWILAQAGLRKTI